MFRSQRKPNSHAIIGFCFLMREYPPQSIKEHKTFIELCAWKTRINMARLSFILSLLLAQRFTTASTSSWMVSSSSSSSTVPPHSGWFASPSEQALLGNCFSDECLFGGSSFWYGTSSGDPTTSSLTNFDDVSFHHENDEAGGLDNTDSNYKRNIHVMKKSHQSFSGTKPTAFIATHDKYHFAPC
jgi:hypothetical protein